MYSDRVTEHFTSPHNAGTMPDADAVGTAGDPANGDLITIAIKVRDNRIDDIKFQTFGCSAAIATSSMVTLLVKGKTLDEARHVTNEAISEALGGLPPEKVQCSNHAADALHRALNDYEAKQSRSM